MLSTNVAVFISKTSSRIRVGLPSLRRAARRASSGSMPCATYCSAVISMNDSSSCRSSSSSCARLMKRRQFMGFPQHLPRRWTHDPADGSNHFVPAGLVRGQLLPARRREPVVLRLAVVLGGTPERRDPTTVLEPMQRRIEGPVFDLEHILRPSLDGLGDGLAMGGTQDQRLQDQHVQRALDHFGLERRMTSGHRLLSMID